MALSNNDLGKIRDYLLGRLSEEEQERIEERLMVEDDFFEELEISKGELIEEYHAGELSQNEHEWFQQHYLATPEGKRRRTFALALDSLERPIPAPAPKPGLLDRLRSLFQNQQLWRIATPAALLIVAGIALPIYLTRSPSYENAQLVNNVAERSPAANQYQKLTLSPDADGLRISLKLPATATPGAKYRAEFDNRTDVETLTPAQQDANTVVVEIPARKLPPGLYALRLYEIKADGTEQRVPGDYRFEIKN
ncbi:MAG TPA: hypothetical protein VF290_18175 [Pyrinomonadaceae bacterium]